MLHSLELSLYTYVLVGKRHADSIETRKKPWMFSKINLLYVQSKTMPPASLLSFQTTSHYLIYKLTLFPGDIFLTTENSIHHSCTSFEI